MEQINPDFLLIIVQVSATLMGFALLGPFVQAASSELLTGRNRYFKLFVIYKRLLFHKSLALFIFLWPFLSSLLLLITQTIRWETSVRILSIVFALGIFFWYWKGIMPTKVRPKVVATITDYIARITVLIYICYAGVAFSLLSFDFFYKVTVIVFMVSGLVFLVDSLLTPIERGILFKVKYKVIESELDPYYKEEVEVCFQDIEDALSNGRKWLQRTETMSPPPGKGLEWHSSIAKYRSEIDFLNRYFDKPWGLKGEWEEIINKGESIHAHLSRFNGDREKVLTEFLPEFERITKEMELKLEKLSEEHE